MKVNEAMTAPVRCCSPNSSLEEVARMMWDSDCGAIPVVGDDDRPVGIITDRDIAMCAMHRHQPLWDIRASQVIEGRGDPVCCNHGDSIDDCVEMMQQAEVRRILVTDDRGALCGIVSLGDAVAFTERETDDDDIAAVESDQLLSMLRRVSGHHRSGDNPLAQHLH
ncbi:MAG TPA: CBS domain-containing protein [Pseudomonadales bacterium]